MVKQSTHLENIPFFSQARFPRLFLIFQYLVGGISDKQKLAVKHYNGQKRILEIGCSVGMVSRAFTKFPQIEFTGIDIDDNALSYAKKLFKGFKNFKFINVSLADMAKSGEKFDYVLFANILHHVDDQTALTLLKDIQLLLSDGARLIVMEPEKIRKDYNLIFKAFYLLEQGQYRRTSGELINIINSSGIQIKNYYHNLMSPNVLPFLKVGRVIVIEAETHKI